MADTLPQIRVRSDTQSRDTDAKIEAPARQSLKDPASNAGNGRPMSPDNMEGTATTSGIRTA